MDINRRRLLGIATAAAVTSILGKQMNLFSVDSALAGSNEPTPCRWHPLTRSLLERANRIHQDRDAPNRAMIERTIRRFADASGWTKPLVIKWMGTPPDAHDHLSRLGLDALLDMGTASFWHRSQPPASPDEETFDRAFEVRMLANQLLGVDEHDRVLTTPKLLTKSQAMLANTSDEEVFRVRAVSSQIGWIETSMADAAAEAVAMAGFENRSGLI